MQEKQKKNNRKSKYKGKSKLILLYKTTKINGISFIKALIPFSRAPPSSQDHIPKITLN